MFFGFGANIFLNSGKIAYNETQLNDNQLKTSQIEKEDIKIAIYNEPNITQPSYSGFSALTNNYTGLTTLLLNNGYDYIELTTNEIYNHKLVTADFDVFIMVDNLPRENITDFVKEFWLGGGSILSFDSALSYLMYAGILIPESEGDENYGTYWAYTNSFTHNISIRHPATKEYEVGDIYTLTKSSNARVTWSSITGTTFEDDLIKLTNVENNNDFASGVALDPTEKGGKVVQLPGTVEEIDSTFEDIILDSIQWLCPRPKARILFDLSHYPYYGIDSWDSEYTTFANRYSIWRDNLVDRSYCVDKLYPSVEGNFTLENLQDYDILVVLWPDVNYTSSEITIVQNWINNGGSLLVLGDRVANERNQRLNSLISNSDISFDPAPSGSNTITFFNTNHPITEACSQLTGASVGELITASPAVNIAGNDASTIMAASQKLGKGRIVVMADINIMDNPYINTDDNLQFGINSINWLSACEARVLIYVVDHSNPDPNDNIYRGPVSKALNLLGEPFYISFEQSYFNLSLGKYKWDLVVIDNTQNSLTGLYYEELIEYIENGGKLILSTWEYYSLPPTPLWEYIGFKYENSISLPPTLNLWSTSHPIFNNPIDFDSIKIETSTDYYGTDASNLTIYENATAIAGLSTSSQNTSCSLILGANGKAIVNGFLLTEYSDDTDDSTYPDSLEIWLNEIYYLLPTVSQGIPGYNMVIFTGLIGLLIGIISIFIYKKRLKH